MPDQSTRTVSVGTAPTRLDDPNISTISEVTYHNTGAQTVYLGDASLSGTAGVPLPAGAVSREKIHPSVKRYAIVSSGTANVLVDQVRTV